VARFANRPLAVLQNIYDFVGDFLSLSDVAIETPIQWVHDVSRESELGAASENGGLGGFWVATVAQAHVALGSIVDGIGLYTTPGTTAFQGTYRVENDDWVWLISSWGVTTDASVFGTAIVNVFAGALLPLNGITDGGGGLVPQGRVAAFWDEANALPLMQGATRRVLLRTDGSSNEHAPILIPRRRATTATDLEIASAATDAITVTISCLIWKGKIGTFPPGYS